MTDWNHTTPLATAAAYPQAMIPLRIEGIDPTNPALDTFAQISAAAFIASLGKGGAISVALFGNLAAVTPPASAVAMLCGGFSTPGIGGGMLVADSLASAALAAGSPRFCGADNTGRYWRMAALNGTIAISQGGALGGTSNDQPAVQAAIDYCRAISCRQLLFDFDIVSMWNSLRTSAAIDPFAQDGQAMCVSAPIKFLGLPTMTHIQLLGATGIGLETGWQNLAGAVWRGSGINLIGGTSQAPNAYGLAYFTMENIWLDGGCAYTGSANTNLTPSAPDGRDLTNKGLRLQGSACDAITLINCTISGFKGEACYIAGTGSTLQILRNCTISGSNQSAFNPSVGMVWADNCNFGNSFIAMEMLGGTGGRLSNCRFYDSIQIGATGGPANGLLYSYAYPTRDLAKTPPWIDFIDCEFVNSGQFLGGNYVRIMRGRFTDVAFFLSTAIVIGALTSTYIDGEYIIDKASQNPIVVIQGPATTTTQLPGAPAGTYIPAPSDVHIKLNIHRTAHAIAQNYFANVFSTSGILDQNSCSLAIGDADGMLFAVTPNYGGNAQGSQPLVTCDGPSSAQIFGVPFAAYTLSMTAGPYAIAMSNPRHSLVNTGAAAAIACTFAAPYAAPYGFANGQRTRVFYGQSSTTGTSYSFAHNGTGLRLNSDCSLALFGDWIEVEFNSMTALWHEIGRSIHAA